MASIATGLDFHTLGKKTSTGAKMRSYSGDPSGGTNSEDAQRSWSKGYSENLIIRDGRTFDDLVRDLKAGHFVHIDVWHRTCDGPCLGNGAGRYGHTEAVAPEYNKGRWLVADPLCSPAEWMWWPESKLRAGAEEWAARVRRGTGGNIPRLEPSDPTTRLLLDAAAKVLMTQFHPGQEAPVDDDIGETGGGGSIRYTITRAQTGGTGGGADDMAITAASGLETNYICRVGTGRDFFADAELTDRLGEFTETTDCVYVGATVGEKVEGGSRAIIKNTATVYADGQARPTVVYVTADACQGGPQAVPKPPPTPVPPPDTAAVKAARDKEWRDWLLSGNPGERTR